MASFNFFDAFTEHLAEKVHNLGSDSLKVALCSAANAPSASADAVLADLSEISYTNLSSRSLTTASSAQTSGDYALTVNDLTLSASGGSVAAFRYIIVYNDTPSSPADPLIGWYDYGSDLTLTSGQSLLIDFSGALITIG